MLSFKAEIGARPAIIDTLAHARCKTGMSCASQVTYPALRWETLLSHFTIEQETELHPNECKAKVDWN